eukprot:TRINITY_DN19852_c0_g4_i1.p1 TRINITY_DN19852_c0_g4~~TRINITY_DN19852_c0_g4_i1.p1  ORF type:complete len:761 (+),score=142.94 TRINITY_DN19852_c0_g4_i1:95-2284(+)
MEPPRPMLTHWLASYMELHAPAPAWVLEEPLPPEEGGPSGICSLLRWSESSEKPEAVRLLRRAGPFTSKLLSTECATFDREYRFYRELAPVVAGHTRSLRAAVAPPHKDPYEELMFDLRQHETTIESTFEVCYTRVIIRDLPKLTSSTQLKMLRKGDKVRGFLKEFGGQAWVEVSEYGKEQLGLDRERPAYVQVNGASQGLGELLKRCNQVPLPDPESTWRRPRARRLKLELPELPGMTARLRPNSPPPVQVSEAATSGSASPQADSGSDSDDDQVNNLGQEGFMTAHLKWSRLYEALLDQSSDREGRWLVIVQQLLRGRHLRVPQCYASYWVKDGDEAWRSFLLVLERLAEPEWLPVDPFVGCSDIQARSAVEALGATHRDFKARRLLDAHDWLPLTPLDLERPYIVHKQFTNCLQDLLENSSLRDVLSPVMLEICERLTDIESFGSKALGRLAKPPLTLLHGDFQPGMKKTALAWSGLRFTRTEPPAVAALDWQWVCRGRGAYDLATFMALAVSVEERREWEPWMLMLYGEAAGGRGGVAARAEFDDDIRAGFLAVLVLFLLRNAGTLVAADYEVDPRTRAAVLLGVERLSIAIEDWDAMKVLGGSELAEQRKEQEEQRRRQERAAARKAGKESLKVKKRLQPREKVSLVEKLRRNQSDSRANSRTVPPADSDRPGKPKASRSPDPAKKGKDAEHSPESPKAKRPASAKSKSPSRPQSSKATDKSKR